MEAGPRLHADKARDISAVFEGINDGWQRHIREAIRVVRQKHFLPLDVFLDGLQTLPDVRGEPCVHERNVPVMDVAAQQLQVLTSLG